MALDYLHLYHSYIPSIESLNDAECGRLFRAILNYSSSGALQKLSGNERFVFPMIKIQIDIDAARYEEKCAKLRENAKRRSKEANASKCKQMQAKEREREEEKESTKEKEEEKDKESMFYLSKITSLVINYLNNITGYKYRASNQKTRKLIQARLNEGYTVDDFKTVIAKMVKAWKGTKMEPYLRPETLFSNKFESYLNRSEVESKDALDMVLGGVFVDIGGCGE